MKAYSCMKVHEGNIYAKTTSTHYTSLLMRTENAKKFLYLPFCAAFIYSDTGTIVPSSLSATEMIAHIMIAFTDMPMVHIHFIRNDELSIISYIKI